MGNTQVTEYLRHSYINLRRHMVNKGLQEAGFLPTQEDKDCIKHGMVPPQLMVDGCHFKKEGYRIFEHTCGPDGAQIYYPCKIFKREYKMIDEINVGSSSISNIKTKYCEDNDPNWWMDHWC